MNRFNKSIILIFLICGFLANTAYSFYEEPCTYDDADLLSYLMEKNGYRWIGVCEVKNYGSHSVYQDGAVGSTFKSGTYAIYKGNPDRIQFSTGNLKSGQTFCAEVVDGKWEKVGRRCANMN